MNAIDIDELNKTIKECTASLYDTEDILEEILFLIDYAPVVEAIPVEQVAKMLASKIDECPMYYGVGEKMELWCHEHSCVDKFHDEYDCCVDEHECWLHALKEGWFDDETNTQD